MAHQTTSTAAQEKKDMILEDEKFLVSFRLADEEFAVNITEVREIVRVGGIIRVPQTPAFVLGVMSLRNALLPVIDLRVRFGMISNAGEAATVGETEIEMLDDETNARRIIVADLGGMTTGLMVDAVAEVLRLPEKDVEPAPEVINLDNAKYITGVGKLNNGNRLLMLLDLSRLFSGEEKETIIAAAGEQQGKGEEPMSREEELEDERQLVCFRIADEEFGIEIMQVREIIRLDAITAVPGTPSYVSGIVNLRGNVLPVIDLRRRFGRESGRLSEQNRILVVDMDDQTTGLIVDAVSEVLRIPEKNIEPAPQILGASASSRYIIGIGKLDGGNRTIILIDTGSVLKQEEIEALPGADGWEQVPSAGTEVSVDDEPGRRSDSGEESDNRRDDGDVALAAEASNLDERKRSSYTRTDTTAEDVAGIVTGTVEKNEAEKKVNEQVSREEIVRGLMTRTKAELLARAKELGLKVDKGITKKQIAGLIVEHR